jgi:hypothetical protein
MIVNEVTNQHLELTEHAKDQWRDRAGMTEDELVEHVRKAVPFGGQFGDNVLYSHGGWVFPTVRKPAIRIVTTVLPYAYAVANMQAAGMAYNPPEAHRQEPISRRKVATDVQVIDTTNVALIAAQHAIAGMGKAARNKAASDAGLDLGGTSGALYRCAFQAAHAVMVTLNASSIEAHNREVLAKNKSVEAA